MLVVRKIILKMAKEVRVKNGLKNLSYSQSESNRSEVKGVGAVILLQNMLKKCMLPRGRDDSCF